MSSSTSTKRKSTDFIDGQSATKKSSITTQEFFRDVLVKPTKKQLKTIIKKLSKEDESLGNYHTLNKIKIAIQQIEKTFAHSRSRGLFIPFILKIEKKYSTTRTFQFWLNTDDDQLQINITLGDDFWSEPNANGGLCYRSNLVEFLRQQPNFIHSITETNIDVLKFFGLTCSSSSSTSPLNVSNCFSSLKVIEMGFLCNNNRDKLLFSSSSLSSLEVNVYYNDATYISKILKLCPEVKNIELFGVISDFSMIEYLLVLVKDGRVFDRVKIRCEGACVLEVPKDTYLKIKTLQIGINESNFNIKSLQAWVCFFNPEHLILRLDMFCYGNKEFMALVETLISFNCTFEGLKVYEVNSEEAKNTTTSGYDSSYRECGFIEFLGENIIKKHNLPKKWVTKHIEWLYTHQNLFDEIFVKEIQDEYNRVNSKFVFYCGSIKSNNAVNAVNAFFNSGLFDIHLTPLVFEFT